MKTETIIALLKELITIPSASPYEKKLVDFLMEYFQKKGYKPIKQKVEENRYNLIITKGKGKNNVILYGHLDTVPVISGWKTNPFQLKIIKDQAYGLGAYDMKGSLAVNILTFLNFQPRNFQLKLVLCVDEENISRGGYKFINSKHLKNNLCIISPEPGFKYGLKGITIGRIGRAVYQIQLITEPQHYIYYQTQTDVSLLASLIIQKLTLFNKEINGVRQFAFVRKISTENTGMSTPSLLMMEIDTALPPGITPLIMLNKIRKQLDSIIDKYPKVTLRVNYFQRSTPFLSGYVLSKSNPYLTMLQKSVKTVISKKAVTYFRNSVADDNIFGSHNYTVLGIGPEGGNAHQNNEWVSLTSLQKLASIYHDFLERINSDSKKLLI